MTDYKWFRLYHEFAKDPKVQSMSEAMQRRLIMLFCLECSGELKTLTDDELAYSLSINSETLHETLQMFQSKKFITEKREICNWMKRQYLSDTSTSRVKKFREKQKLVKMKRYRNVTVTPPDTDTDTDTEDNNNKLPDWIPKNDWDDWIAQRKKKPTRRAIELAIMKLDEFRKSGHDPSAVLQHCIMNGYQGLFLPKRGNNEANRGNTTGTESKWVSEGKRLANKYRAQALAEGEG